MTFIADEAAFDAPAFGIIGSPLFNAPPSLGKMAAGGEWERAEVFQPGCFISEEEVKKYLGKKDEIACEAFFCDAFFGARKRGTPEKLVRFVLDFNRALALSANGRDFFRRVAERPGIPVGNGFLFAEVGAVDAWKSVGPFRIEDPCAALEHFKELLSKLNAPPQAEKENTPRPSSSLSAAAANTGSPSPSPKAPSSSPPCLRTRCGSGANRVKENASP